MTIVFDSISSNNRVPGSQAEFASSRALTGLPPAPYKLLLVGQRTSAGSVQALVPQRITQVSQGLDYFGRGSQLAGMVAAALRANDTTELWAIALDDNAAGVAAVSTITLDGSPTAAGTLSYLVAGQSIKVGVLPSDTVTTMAAAVAAAINAAVSLPVTAAAAAGVVTVTARHKGTLGNDIDLRQNHYDGEALPPGVASTIAVSVAGATNPDLTTVWAKLGDEQFQAIAVGVNDAAAVTSADTELTSRWGPQRQIEGRAYFGMQASVASLLSFGATRNGIFSTVLGLYLSPTPSWEIAAAAAAIAAFQLEIDPARPLTNLVLPGVIAPKIERRFTAPERNQLLRSGISTVKVLPDGTVAIERLISTYRKDAFGFDDPSYLDITITATLGYFRYSWRERMAQKFPRAKLTDGTIAAVRAETIALAREWEDAELVEDIDGFIASLTLERSTVNATQLNLLAAPNVVDGLLQFAARFEFIG